MTAALLAVKIEIANFDAITAAIMPFNLRIGIFHINLSSQRQAEGPGDFNPKLLKNKYFLLNRIVSKSRAVSPVPLKRLVRSHFCNLLSFSPTRGKPI
jgi:hypothetical protein